MIMPLVLTSPELTRHFSDLPLGISLLHLLEQYRLCSTCACYRDPSRESRQTRLAPRFVADQRQGDWKAIMQKRFKTFEETRMEVGWYLESEIRQRYHECGSRIYRHTANIQGWTVHSVCKAEQYRSESSNLKLSNTDPARPFAAPYIRECGNRFGAQTAWICFRTLAIGPILFFSDRKR